MRHVSDVLTILKVVAVVVGVALLLWFIRDPLAVLAGIAGGAAAIFGPARPGTGPRRTGSGNIPGGDTPSGDGTGTPATPGDSTTGGRTGPRRRRR